MSQKSLHLDAYFSSGITVEVPSTPATSFFHWMAPSRTSMLEGTQAIDISVLSRLRMGHLPLRGPYNHVDCIWGSTGTLVSSVPSHSLHPFWFPFKYFPPLECKLLEDRDFLPVFIFPVLSTMHGTYMVNIFHKCLLTGFYLVKVNWPHTTYSRNYFLWSNGNWTFESKDLMWVLALAIYYNCETSHCTSLSLSYPICEIQRIKLWNKRNKVCKMPCQL